MFDEVLILLSVVRFGLVDKVGILRLELGLHWLMRWGYC